MKKLNIEKLKVKSFVTEVEGLSKQTVNGGGSQTPALCKLTTDEVWSMQPLQSICSPCITPHTNLERCVTVDPNDYVTTVNNIRTFSNC